MCRSTVELAALQNLRLPLLSRPTMPGTNTTACAAEADMLSNLTPRPARRTLQCG